MRLCRLSLHHPGVVSSCQLVVAMPLVVPSLCRPFAVLLLQLVVASPLIVLSLRCPLVVLSRQLVVAFPLAVLSLRHPLVNLLLQLVVALPLLVLLLRPAPQSCPLVVPAGCCITSQCGLSLSCRASWLSRHHLLSSSCCTAISSLSLCWLVVALPVLAPPSQRVTSMLIPRILSWRENSCVPTISCLDN